ncbi:MAG: glycosyltransferase family 4 protein, partial [Longimicrobiales bacterium]
VLPDGSPCRHGTGRACHREGCVSLAGLGRVLVQHGLWQRWRDVFDAIVANSEWTMRRVRAEGVPATIAIHNGVAVRPARPPLAAPPTVGYAGRLVAKKGLDLLLRAVARVAEDVPAVALVIAGDGPDRAAVEATVRALALESRVTMLGHVAHAELENALAPAWVQAVPSIWEEPFGLVAAEAMMRGTAVIASDTGGLTETVRHERTGLLVPSGDDAALANALGRLLRDHGLVERMGAAGRAIALAELTEDRVTERFLDVYESLLARGASRPAASL